MKSKFIGDTFKTDISFWIYEACPYIFETLAFYTEHNDVDK